MYRVHSHGVFRALAGGSARLVATRVVGVLLQLAVGIALARTLGAASYGDYSYAMAVVNLLVVPATLGLPHLATREVAIYGANGEYALLRGILRRSHQGVLLAGLLCGALILAGGVAGLRGNAPGARSSLMVAAAIVPVLALIRLEGGLLRGLGQPSHGAWPEQLLRPLLILIAVVAYGHVRSSPLESAAAAIIVHLAALAVALTVSLFLTRRSLSLEVSATDPAYRTRYWLRVALPFLLVGTLEIVNMRVDLLMLGLLRSSGEVGIYNAVMQGANTGTFVLVAVGMVSAPTLARLYSRGDTAGFRRTAKRGAQIALVGTIPIVAVLVFGGEFLLGALFGSEFVVGSTALAILAAAQLVNVGTGPVGTSLSMTGNQREAAIGAAIAAAINLILNALLIPKFGMEGAAIASAVSLAVWNVLLVVLMRLKTGILTTPI